MIEERTHYVEENKVMSYSSSRKFMIFLDEVISDTAYYRSAIYTLKTASSSDVVEIMFDTGGGNCSAASTISAAILACNALVVGNLAGVCASAGANIALNCDEWVVGADLIFMCHTSSYGVHNSAEKLRDQVTFMDKHNDACLRRDYEGFLTGAEIENIITQGKEYWFDADQTLDRLNNLGNFRKERKALSQRARDDIFHEKSNRVVDGIIFDLDITAEEEAAFRKVRKLIDTSQDSE